GLRATIVIGSTVRRRPRFFNFLCAALLATAPAWPQASAGIDGKVEDASGAPISGATVTVKNLETGATRVVTTDDAGAFRALSLPLGAQEVKAQKNGFKSAIRTGI